MMMKFVVAGILPVFLAVFALAAIAAPAAAGDHGRARCKSCPAPKTYDSQEVVNTTRDVDHSRVINTQSVVPVSKRYRTTDHLVIRRNAIRHVGVVRHNHTIIEKEIRYRRPAVRLRSRPIVINFVVQEYREVRRPALVRDDRIVYPRRKAHRVPLRVRG